MQCGTDKFFPNRTKIQGRLFRGPGDPRVGTRGCCNTEEPGKRRARTLKFQRTRCYNCSSALTAGFDRPRAPDVSTRKKKKNKWVLRIQDVKGLSREVHAEELGNKELTHKRQVELEEELKGESGRKMVRLIVGRESRNWSLRNRELGIGNLA